MTPIVSLSLNYCTFWRRAGNLGPIRPASPCGSQGGHRLSATEEHDVFIGEHEVPKLPRTGFKQQPRQRQAKGFQSYSPCGGLLRIIALGAWSSFGASSRHAVCRQAFGLTSRQIRSVAP